MISWLKRFALSFFSNKYMRESVHCGIGTVLLTCLLSVLILFFGIFIGKYVFFAVDYNGASEFKEFVYGAFIDNSGLTLDISVRNGKAEVTVNGEHVLINTFEDDNDKQRYCKNGYSLIVDYRDMTNAYDDFTIVCESVSGGASIEYSDYLTLSEREKIGYTLKMSYSGTLKTLSDTDVTEYEKYLAGTSAAEELRTIAEKNSDDRSAYESELYKLYVKTYYPDLKSLCGEDVPTLKKYYYDLIVVANEKYLCIFGDMMIGSFENDLGKNVSFGCVYTGVHLDAASSSAGARTLLDGFIKQLYYDNLSTLLFLEILNGLIIIMVAVLIIILAMILSRVTCRIKRINIGSDFSSCVKAVGSCIHVAALVAAVATVIFGFFRSGVALIVLCYSVFAIALAVRIAVFYISEYASQNRDKAIDAGDTVDRESV